MKKEPETKTRFIKPGCYSCAWWMRGGDAICTHGPGGEAELDLTYFGAGHYRHLCMLPREFSPSQFYTSRYFVCPKFMYRVKEQNND